MKRLAAVLLTTLMLLLMAIPSLTWAATGDKPPTETALAQQEDSILQRINSTPDINTTLNNTKKFADRGTNKIWLFAKAYSVPILVFSFIGAGFMIFLSFIFGAKLRIAGWGLMGAGILAFILINYAPQFAGVIIKAMNSALKD
ncbi:MAG: hypothetical protein ACYCX4_03570 [Bacillota bacterium]